MKKTVLLLLCFSTFSFAQNINFDQLGKNKFLQYNGGINASSVFYEGQSNRDPFPVELGITPKANNVASVEAPTEILIIEVKQFKQRKIAEFDGIATASGYDAPSGLTLNPNTGLPTQMSDPWVFNHVLSKMENGTLDQVKLATGMQNQNIVSKYVFAIDKSTGDGYFTKLGSFK